MELKHRSIDRSFPFFKRVWPGSRGPEIYPEYRIYGPEVLLFQMLRVFGLAPVSMKPRRKGCAVILSRNYIIYCYVKYISIALIISIGFMYDVFDEESGIKRNNLTLVIWALNVSLPLWFICTGALRSMTRTSKLLSFLKEARNINEEFGKFSATLSTAYNTQLRTRVMIVLFIIFSSSVLKLYALVTTDSSPGLFLNTYKFFCFYVNNVIATLLEMQLVHVVHYMKYVVHTLNWRMKTVLQKLRMNKSATCESESLKEIRYITDQYLVTRRLTHQINDSEGTLMLLIFIVLGYHINMSTYRIYLAVKATSHITFKVLKITERVLVCLQRWSLLLLLVESCHQTRQELFKTRFLVSELLCCTPSALSPLSGTLQRFAAQLQLTSSVFIPLGVFTISRSLYTAVIGSVTTFFTVALKYIREWG